MQRAGFIIEDGYTEDLFAHFSSIQMEVIGPLKAGQTVEFEKDLGKLTPSTFSLYSK